jgi:hypothetical protein
VPNQLDAEPQFFRSHLKDHPNQSPLTTHEGIWRIYSNPDPHEGISSFNLAVESLDKSEELFQLARECGDSKLIRQWNCTNTK